MYVCMYEANRQLNEQGWPSSGKMFAIGQNSIFLGGRFHGWVVRDVDKMNGSEEDLPWIGSDRWLVADSQRDTDSMTDR